MYKEGMETYNHLIKLRKLKLKLLVQVHVCYHAVITTCMTKQITIYTIPCNKL